MQYHNNRRWSLFLLREKTIGVSWISIGISEDVQKSIRDVMQKNQKNADEIHTGWLLYAVFIVLGEFYTAPYSLETNQGKLPREIKGCRKDLESGDVKFTAELDRTIDIYSDEDEFRE